MASSKNYMILLVITILTITFNSASAADPDPLQDVCVADLNSTITVNGFPCKRNFTFTPEDFASMGIAQPGVPNIFGTRVGVADVFNMPGLNTQGVSMARVDFERDGLNPPHTHPRATEIIFVKEGTLVAGFITTDNIFVNKLITKGEVFVFPRGLIHFQFNVGRGNATIIVAFNSQNPGVQLIALSMFASRPQIPEEVVARAFQTSVEEVRAIRARLALPTAGLPSGWDDRNTHSQYDKRDDRNMYSQYDKCEDRNMYSQYDKRDDRNKYSQYDNRDYRNIYSQYDKREDRNIYSRYDIM
ncbi:PREDICTED: germin-like protein subfamily 2 member 1 [Nicotiana attenuata]|uniref:Germin-like protein n=1 Tax=Nicotiana attenuata TaxID=49451 RepID=A0A314KNV6_NICAT|nr:PREDICTED: germin-like protein subfamily 2 member 1 [Nicotiana attenuata]OIT30855.1 nectarin-1 [Nicotiana attenuata]